MLQSPPPIPLNEQERLISLAEFDIDYSSLESNFKDLALLAAKIAGTEISLINLIDSVTQWTVSNHGLDINQMPRKESVCQYTIASESHFEVPDLSIDERFHNRFYVRGPLSLKYYLGVPLTTTEGYHIGALCVVDSKLRSMSQEKIDMLKMVADEVVNRLRSMKTIENLQQQLVQAKEVQKKVAHDIRGPVAGIIGLTGLIIQQGKDNNPDDVLECISLIQKSGKSVLDLADEILYRDKTQSLKVEPFNLLIFKDKLERLYQPQATNKNISFEVNINEKNAHIPFLKNKLLQITGNLVSNAMKFTPENGKVKAVLEFVAEATNNLLKIRIEDDGMGMDQKSIDLIMQGETFSGSGTSGEKGYGFGLSMVKQLVDGLNGNFSIHSEVGKGTLIEITIKQDYLPNVSFYDAL